ncbi:MAG: class I SAM-dependent methyltransferase [Steroidobacteraceae bacterium]
MTQLEQLRSRMQLQIEGDVCQRGAPQGLYADGWSNGALTVTVQPARRVAGFSVEGLIPDWWPAGTSIGVELDGEPAIETEAVPGNVNLACEARLAAGSIATVCIRTSATAHDLPQNRQLGAYVSALRFRCEGAAPFRCNVCGAAVADLEPLLDPEGSPCGGCGSNIRKRSLAHLVGNTLFGETLAIDEFPAHCTASGFGISDDLELARRLKRAIPRYVNTQFDAELVNRKAPFLDVKSPPRRLVGSADFVTCSEVLEHVEPPVQPAFDGLYSLLRPGGTLILTVPYTLDRTVEHFPDLHAWELRQRDGTRVLINRTRHGAVQEFDDLCFHGGGNAVLEMRVFGLEGIFANLKAAGFTEIRVRDENVLAHGIFLKYNWGLPITARRPAHR